METSSAVRRVPWSLETEVALVEKVRDYRNLWDQRDLLYTNKTLKKAVYHEIAEFLVEMYPELGLVNADCLNSKFANLKTYFRREYRKYQGKKRYSGKWKLYDHMAFLHEVMDFELERSNDPVNGATGMPSGGRNCDDVEDSSVRSSEVRHSNVRSRGGNRNASVNSSKVRSKGVNRGVSSEGGDYSTRSCVVDKVVSSGNNESNVNKGASSEVEYSNLSGDEDMDSKEGSEPSPYASNIHEPRVKIEVDNDPESSSRLLGHDSEVSEQPDRNERISSPEMADSEPSTSRPCKKNTGASETRLGTSASNLSMKAVKRTRRSTRLSDKRLASSERITCEPSIPNLIMTSKKPKRRKHRGKETSLVKTAFSHLADAISKREDKLTNFGLYLAEAIRELPMELGDDLISEINQLVFEIKDKNN